MLRFALAATLATATLATLPAGPERIAPGCSSDLACERSAPAFVTIRGNVPEASDERVDDMADWSDDDTDEPLAQVETIGNPFVASR